MKLVEKCEGLGELMRDGRMLRRVQYRLDRYQGMLEGSGMPIPGLHRIEGSVQFDAAGVDPDWIGAGLALKLEDGRVFGITLIDTDGRILSEGHGPSRCRCC